MDDELRQRIGIAIWAVRNQIRWKSGKGEAHLRTRQQYGHLPASATLSSYETIIRSVVLDENADVYLYRWHTSAVYPTIVREFEGIRWLVMFNLDGIMETAFPPTDVEEYLSDSRFAFLGLMQEILG